MIAGKGAGGAGQTKIVRVIARLNVGGPSIHAVLLTQGLNDDRWASVLVTGTVGKLEGDMGYFADAQGVTPLVVPELGREISWFDDLTALRKLVGIFRRERPCIVHTHTAKAGTLGRLAALLAGVPIRIHTFHGHVFHGYFSPIKTALFLWIERCLAVVTTKIVAISAAQRDQLSGTFRIAPREKFSVIPLGLDLAPFLAIDRIQEPDGRREDSRPFHIGFVGRLVPIKRPALAVDAFRRLVEIRKGHVSPVLLFVGNGELREAVEDAAVRSGIRAHVRFIGWERDLGRVYEKLDVLLLTSENEGTPVALIEAMAAGVPFVATRVGGLPDLMAGREQVVRRDGGRTVFSVWDNGILVAPGDVDGAAAGMEYLLSDALLRRRMGDAGRAFVTARFSKERLVRDVATLYEQELAAVGLRR